MAPYVRRAVGPLLVSLGILAAGLPSSAGAAELEIVPGSFAVTALNAEGQLENRAAAHPDVLRTEFSLRSEGTSASELEFDLPPGLTGSPDAVPLCPRSLAEHKEECPPDTQVGEIGLSSGSEETALPIFALEPLPGQLLAFGSKASLGLSLTAKLRPNDFGTTLEALDLPTQESISVGQVELWGIPADHQVGSTIPRRPLLALPAQCGPMAFAMRARSADEAVPAVSAESESAPLEGCQDLGFSPGFAVQLSAAVTDAPTGLRMDLTTPREDGPGGRAEAPIETVAIAMPKGVAVSPAGAAGLVACTDAQLGQGTDVAPQCPPASRVGTIELESTALGGVASGTIYLGEEHRGERFRIFIVAQGLGGTLKLAAALAVDPSTGRLSTTLRGLPQVPISRLSIEFQGGPSALLATPLTCGPAAADASFAPYGDGPPVSAVASATVASRYLGLSCPGPIPFVPRLELAGSSPLAGRPSAISASLQRRDGEQLPRRFSIALPIGLGFAFSSLDTCSEAAAAAANCPSASRSGSAVAQVGSGPSPATLRGSVYLTGPYRRAPFGLLMTFPAAVGPFHLGSIAVRAALPVDGQTGRASVVSDPLPELVDGVPIRFRTITLSFDRPGLLRNPTSCRARNADAVLESQGGASVGLASPLTVKGCERLHFRPRVAMEVDARRGARRARFRVSARFRRGDSGLRAMRLTLPPALKMRMAGLDAICSRLDAARGTCPDGSLVGFASARTPLFDESLEGSVYVVQPGGNGLPDLGISLQAGGLRIGLTGSVSSRHGRLVTNLTGLPDMALSTLSLVLGDRRSGLISLERSPCAGDEPRQLAGRALFKAQNGARRTLSPPIRTMARCP